MRAGRPVARAAQRSAPVIDAGGHCETRRAEAIQSVTHNPRIASLRSQ